MCGVCLKFKDILNSKKYGILDGHELLKKSIYSKCSLFQLYNFDEKIY